MQTITTYVCTYVESRISDNVPSSIEEFTSSFRKLRFGKTALFRCTYVSVSRLQPGGCCTLSLLAEQKKKKQKKEKNSKDLYPKKKKRKECSLKAFSIRSSTFTRYPPRGRSDYFSLRKKSQINEMYNCREKKKKKKKKRKKKREILLYRGVRGKFNEYIRPTCQWTR